MTDRRGKALGEPIEERLKREVANLEKAYIQLRCQTSQSCCTYPQCGGCIYKLEVNNIKKWRT